MVVPDSFEQPRETHPEERLPVRDDVVEVRPDGRRSDRLEESDLVPDPWEPREHLVGPGVRRVAAQGTAPVVKADEPVLVVYVDPGVREDEGEEPGLRDGMGKRGDLFREFSEPEVHLLVAEPR